MLTTTIDYILDRGDSGSPECSQALRTPVYFVCI